MNPSAEVLRWDLLGRVKLNHFSPAWDVRLVPVAEALSAVLITPEVNPADTFVGEDMGYSLGFDDVVEGQEGWCCDKWSA